MKNYASIETMHYGTRNILRGNPFQEDMDTKLLHSTIGISLDHAGKLANVEGWGLGITKESRIN